MGATGEYWYYQKLGIQPDILVFGKKAQVSGVVASEDYLEVLDHPSMKIHQTFDGDLIDCLRFLYIKKAIEQEDLLEKVKKQGRRLFESLNKTFLNVRGEGFLMAYDFNTQEERDKHSEISFDNHLLIHKSGERSIRLRPNLDLSEKEIDSFLKTI